MTTPTLEDFIYNCRVTPTIDGPKELANQLGVAKEQLIGVYAQRAPLEWIDVYVAWAVSGIGLLLVAIPIVLFIRHGEADIKGKNMRGVSEICLIAGGILFILGAAFGTAELSEAIKATSAPQAYAIDVIIKHI